MRSQRGNPAVRLQACQMLCVAVAGPSVVLHRQPCLGVGQLLPHIASAPQSRSDPETTMQLGDFRVWLERITLLGGRVRACCSSAGKGNWSIALHRGRGSCTRSSGPLYTIVVGSYKVSDVARSVHAVVPGNRAAITLATTRFLYTCTMIPLKICSSQAVEKGQISGGIDSRFVLTWHVLCETERPRLAADLAQPRGPDGEVRGRNSTNDWMCISERKLLPASAQPFSMR